MKMDDACQINFHLGLLFVLTSGLSYPIIQTPKPMSEYPWAFLLCGVPQCIAQQLFIMGLQMVKDTGVATLFLFVSVITGYTYSTLRYH